MQLIAYVLRSVNFQKPLEQLHNEYNRLKSRWCMHLLLMLRLLPFLFPFKSPLRNNFMCFLNELRLKDYAH